MINDVMFSSRTEEWETPQKFYDELNKEFNFTVDVAATKDNAKAPLYFTKEIDGLKQSWNVGGTVFCNPPYGRKIAAWVKKAYDEAKKGIKIVLLIPARTDTKYFHDYIYGHAESRFIRGRLKFTNENGDPVDRAPFPSMVVIYN